MVKIATKLPEFNEMEPENPEDSNLEDTPKVMGLPTDRYLERGKEEDSVFKKGIYKCQEISCVAKSDTNYLKNS